MRSLASPSPSSPLRRPCGLPGEILLSCPIGKKQLELCLTSQSLTYSFGPRGAPEITLTDAIRDVAYSPWPGVGGYIFDSVTFTNRGTSYEVWTSLERNPDKRPDRSRDQRHRRRADHRRTRLRAGQRHLRPLPRLRRERGRRPMLEPRGPGVAGRRLPLIALCTPLPLAPAALRPTFPPCPPLVPSSAPPPPNPNPRGGRGLQGLPHHARRRCAKAGTTRVSARIEKDGQTHDLVRADTMASRWKTRPPSLSRRRAR